MSFTVALRCAFNASIWARLETPDSASAVCDLKARLMAAAHSGNSKTVRAPPATRSDAVELSSSPELVAILVTATIIGRPAAEYSANSIFSLIDCSPEPVFVNRSAINTGTPRTSRIPITTIASSRGEDATTEGLIPMPLTTKNSGIMNVNPTVSNRAVIM